MNNDSTGTDVELITGVPTFVVCVAVLLYCSVCLLFNLIGLIVRARAKGENHTFFFFNKTKISLGNMAVHTAFFLPLMCLIYMRTVSVILRVTILFVSEEALSAAQGALIIIGHGLIFTAVSSNAYYRLYTVAVSEHTWFRTRARAFSVCMATVFVCVTSLIWAPIITTSVIGIFKLHEKVGNIVFAILFISYFGLMFVSLLAVTVPTVMAGLRLIVLLMRMIRKRSAWAQRVNAVKLLLTTMFYPSVLKAGITRRRRPSETPLSRYS